eukprot:13725249-Alexandrium_andersonii.AAC.1
MAGFSERRLADSQCTVPCVHSCLLSHKCWDLSLPHVCSVCNAANVVRVSDWPRNGVCLCKEMLRALSWPHCDSCVAQAMP